MPILTCPIAEQAKGAPTQIAIQLGARPISFSELHLQVLTFQSWLRKHGISGGSHIAIASKTAEWVIPLLYACFREQVVCVCLNPALPQSEALAEETRCLAVFKDEDLLEIISNPTTLEGPMSIQFSTQQWATMVRTSGTSGIPKWAVHSIGNHSFSALGANQNMPLSPDSRCLLTLPLFHVGGIGLLFRCFTAGACIVIDPQKRPLLSALIDFKPTHVSVVPTQLYWLMNDLEKKPVSIKTRFLVGGAPLPITLAHRALHFQLAVYPTYGLTEMSSQVATVSAPITADYRATVGKALLYRELKIDSKNQIWVKGAPLFQGYWESGKVILSTDADGFFSTGDLGELTESGDLRIWGRQDSLIISGGENIQPEEVEAALLGIPGIEQAVVVARSHDELGQRPVAFLKTTSPLSKEVLISELEKGLPRFKIPDDFFPWPTFDVEPGLKICRSDFLKNDIVE